jgi:branched-chain amino acid transport system substrate-binding protein
MRKIVAVVLILCAAALAFAGPGADRDSAAGPIKIGGIFPLSGNVAVYGVEAQKGIQLAIAEINASGGVLGRQLTLISEDDQGNPEISVNSYRKLTSQDKVNIIIGSLTSGCTIAITSFAQAQKVVLVAPAATAAAVTDAGNFVFRACYTDSFQGTVGGAFAANTLGTRRAAVLFDNQNDYSVGLKDNFVSAFQRNGGTVVAQESYMTNDVDFNAQITKIKAANPDVVYLPDYYNTVALIAKQLRAQGINTPIVGADGWDGLTENAGEEVLNGFYSNHYASDSTEPRVVNFVRDFTAKFGTVPNAFSALGYDSMYLIRDAIARAGSTDSESVRAALAQTNGAYLTGNLSFDSNRNPVKSAVIQEIVRGADGRLTTVYKTTVNP